MNMKYVSIFISLFFVIISLSTLSAEDIDSSTNISDMAYDYTDSVYSAGDYTANSMESTELMETHSSNCKVGNDLSINGSLKDGNGNPIGNADILMDFNGIAYGDSEYVHYSSKSLKTNEDGLYSYNYKLDNAGILNYTIQYDGNERYESNQISGSIFIYPKSTQVTVNPIKQITVGESIELTGKLTSENTTLRYTSVGILISQMAYGENHFVNLSKEYVRTDENGFYTYIYKPPTAGRLNMCVYYPGYHNYRFNQTKVSTFVLAKSTNVSICPVSNVTVGENITIAGKLTYGDDNPLRYTSVGIRIYYPEHYYYENNEISHNYVRTNDEGIYNFTYTPSRSGKYYITCYYPGYHDYAYSCCKEYVKVNTTNEAIIKKIYQNNATSIIIQGQIIINELLKQKDYTFDGGQLSVRVSPIDSYDSTWLNLHADSNGIFYVYMTSFDRYNQVKLDSGIYSIWIIYRHRSAGISEFSSPLSYFEVNKTGDNVTLLRFSREDDSLDIPGDTYKGPGKIDLIITNFYVNDNVKIKLFDGRVITENPYEFKQECVVITTRENTTERHYDYFNVNPDGTFSADKTFPYKDGITKFEIVYHDIGLDLSKKFDVYQEHYLEGKFVRQRIVLEKSNFKNVTVLNFDQTLLDYNTEEYY